MSGNVLQHAKVVLITEDERCETFVRESLGDDFHLCVAPPGSNIRRVVEESAPNLMLADLRDTSHMGVFTSVKAQVGASGSPIVVLSDDDDVQAQAFELGAADCLRESISPLVFRWKIRNLVAGLQTLDNLEESLSEAHRKIEELGSFLQMVAHDLKSPAAAVCGFVRLLKRSTSQMPLDKRIDEILTHLSNASNTIQEFLQDVSAFTVMERMDYEPAPVMIAEAITEVVDRSRHLIDEKAIKLELNLGAPGLELMGSKRKIQQVLDNLLRNAIFHMETSIGPLIRIDVTERDDAFVITTMDNGVGIPEMHREQVFEKFFRVNRSGQQPGTGLGLYIAKCIVESHGGRIWIEGPPGGGTEVCFTVPKPGPVS